VPHDYSTVQEAIDAANPGDTIYVQSGTYNEHVVVDKPSLTLVGEDRVNTIITGEPEADVISLKANGAKIVDFTLTHGYAGIQISPWTHGHQVTSNIIMENDFGVRGHYDVYDIVISNNTISSNTLVGIEVAFYNSNVTCNVVSNNGRGEFVELSAGIEILEAVYDTTVYSNNNMFVNNVIENNFNGVLSVWYSEENLFSHNTFKNNTNNVFAVDPTSMNNNTVYENYWSDYSGEDKNGDGFGDTPYWFDAQNKDTHPLMSPYKYWSNPLVGDINKNMRVDITDLAIAARAFGTSPSYPSWNPNADINKDNRIDIRDLVLIAKNFGKTYI
jgi:nitrous oxidase accessory protein NosD